MDKKLLSLTFCLILCFCTAFGETKQGIRERFAEIASVSQEEPVFETEPDTASFQTVGRMTQSHLNNALEYVNLIRMIAGLEPVELNELYILRAQHAAALLAANDEISHEPEPCTGISGMQYETALAGARESNISKLPWSGAQVLIQGISYFERDDGENNVMSLPHRRWLLNPEMGETGFGLATAQSGNSYITMYAVDQGRTDVLWDHVAWPAEGLFPAEMMRSSLAWSLSLNDDIYDVPSSRITVELLEEVSGSVFTFDISAGTGDGVCGISEEDYGSGHCVIFVPNLSKGQIINYEQNQKWRVTVSGLLKRDGTQCTIEYECEMISLVAQDVVSVELAVRDIRLRIGETTALSATVIPAYADDASICWSVDDLSIAAIDGEGNLTGISEGSCTVTASAANGISDTCTVIVHK